MRTLQGEHCDITLQVWKQRIREVSSLIPQLLSDGATTLQQILEWKRKVFKAKGFLSTSAGAVVPEPQTGHY